jgi:hypothetical protein
MASRVQQLLHATLALVTLCQFGRIKLVLLVEDVVNGTRFARDGGNELGDPVDLGERNVERPTHVAHGGARAQRSKGNDLCDLVIAVLSNRILYHFVPAVVGIIKVDIRHGDATGIEKPLKDEAVFEWINACDA